MLKKRWSLRDLLPPKNDPKGAKSSSLLDEENDGFFNSHHGRPPPLPSKVEKELRLACNAIMQDIVPAEFLNSPENDADTAREIIETSLVGALQSNRISVGDFPMPIANEKRMSKYTYRPDATLEDLGFSNDVPVRFGPGPDTCANNDHESFTVQAQTSRPMSTSISVTTNIITAKAERASFEINAVQTEIRGHSMHDKIFEKNPRARNNSTIFQATSNENVYRPRSRTRTITEGVPEHFRSGSADRSRSVSRAPSVNSARSSASSGVMPARMSRFSLRNLRYSWSSWMSASDDEGFSKGDRARSRAEKTRSGDGNKRWSFNLYPKGELPPLPGLNLWKADETERPKSHMAKLWNRSHISVPTEFELREEEVVREMPVDHKFSTSTFLKVATPPDNLVSDPFSTLTPEKAVTPLEAAAVSSQASPIMPTASTPEPSSSPIFRIRRKPVPVSALSQTDSVMDGQDLGLKPAESTLSTEQPVKAESDPRVEIATVAAGLTAPVRPSRPRSQTTYSFCAPKVDTKRHSALPRFQYIDCVTTGSPELVQRKFKPAPKEDKPTMIAPVILITAPGSTEKRRPSRLDLDIVQEMDSVLPKLYEREVDENSGETSFQRNMSIFDYNALRNARYKFADDISTLCTKPALAPEPATIMDSKKEVSKKSIWPWKRTKKTKTWMDQMEKMGIKDGVLVTDNLNAAPIVRY